MENAHFFIPNFFPEYTEIKVFMLWERTESMTVVESHREQTEVRHHAIIFTLKPSVCRSHKSFVLYFVH